MPHMKVAATQLHSIEKPTNARGSTPTYSAVTAGYARRTSRASKPGRAGRPNLAHDRGVLAQRHALLQTTLDSIEKIEIFVTRIQQNVLQARQSACTEERSRLAQRYETLCAGVDLCTQSASYAGTNLINGSRQQLVISYGRNTPSRFIIIHTDLTAGSSGLNLPHTASNFAHNEDVDYAQAALNYARQRLEWARNHIHQSLQVLRCNADMQTESRLAHKQQNG